MGAAACQQSSWLVSWRKRPPPCPGRWGLTSKRGAPLSLAPALSLGQPSPAQTRRALPSATIARLCCASQLVLRRAGCSPRHGGPGRAEGGKERGGEGAAGLGLDVERGGGTKRARARQGGRRAGGVGGA